MAYGVVLGAAISSVMHSEGYAVEMDEKNGVAEVIWDRKLDLFSCP